MGDTSQSRYSIVERLTMEKLRVMEQQQEIDGKIESMKIRLKHKENEYNVEKVKLEKDLQNSLKYIQDEINTTKQNIAQEEKDRTTKSELCDDKIIELDKALRAIQEISKASAEEAKS